MSHPPLLSAPIFWLCASVCINLWIEQTKRGAGETAQWVQHSSHKPKDPNLSPWNPQHNLQAQAPTVTWESELAESPEAQSVANGDPTSNKVEARTDNKVVL